MAIGSKIVELIMDQTALVSISNVILILVGESTLIQAMILAQIFSVDLQLIPKKKQKQFSLQLISSVEFNQLI